MIDAVFLPWRWPHFIRHRRAIARMVERVDEKLSDESVRELFESGEWGDRHVAGRVLRRRARGGN